MRVAVRKRQPEPCFQPINNNNSLPILLVDVHSFPERLRHVERCWAWEVQRRVEVVHPVAVWMLRQEDDF